MTDFSGIQFSGTFRSYQQRVLGEYQTLLSDGHIHVVAAPGSGKTILGLELVRRLGAPALVLAPSVAIRQQWGERFAGFYLPAGADLADYYSEDLAHPKLLTAITYQALFSAVKGIRNPEEDAEPDMDEDPDEDADNAGTTGGRSITAGAADVAKLLRAHGVTTLCLDEAHHLRSEWYQSIMAVLEKLGAGTAGSAPAVRTIALTATPPYDSTPAEWNKYISLCGEIDEEIFVPELVKDGTLCPHQDYVYLCRPTEKESKLYAEYRERANDFCRDLAATTILADALSSCGVLAENETAEDLLYGHLEEFRALFRAAEDAGVTIPPHTKRLAPGGRIIGEPLLAYTEKACNFILTEKDIFPETVSEPLLALARKYALTERRKILLTSKKKITDMLYSSVGKLDGIRAIVTEEQRNLGEGLRMLILTDFIRQNLRHLIGSEEPVTGVGTVPVFETVRRIFPSGRIALLSGSLTVIPDKCLPAAEEAAQKHNATVSLKPSGAPGFSFASFTGGSKTAVTVLTELLGSGEIHILVGTKSLLGEGWDSPCINSLILASFVGSFMLSNQMRGRAIRKDSHQPEKAANIWHLVTLNPDTIGDLAKASLNPGTAVKTDVSEDEDFARLARRFRCFMGPAYNHDVIESGIERLCLTGPFTRASMDRTNAETLRRAADRRAMAEQWKRALVSSASAGAEVTRTAEADPSALPKPFSLRALPGGALIAVILYAYLLIVPDLFGLAFEYENKILFTALIIGSIALFLALFFGVRRYAKLHSPVRFMKGFGRALLKSLKETGIITSTGAKVSVRRSETRNGDLICSLEGASLREKEVFAKSLSEGFAPLTNPRYVVRIRKWWKP